MDLHAFALDADTPVPTRRLNRALNDLGLEVYDDTFRPCDGHEGHDDFDDIEGDLR